MSLLTGQPVDAPTCIRTCVGPNLQAPLNATSEAMVWACLHLGCQVPNQQETVISALSRSWRCTAMGC